MKSIIICEGNTDLVLIQYFLEKTYQWQYVSSNHHKDEMNRITNPQNQKWFIHSSGNYLCIASAGGCSQIPKLLEKCLDYNSIGPQYPFERIVIICDRDEAGTETSFFNKLLAECSQFNVQFDSTMTNNIWNTAQYTDAFQNDRILSFLPLVIPFEDTGAIETFLLNAIRQASEQNDPLMIDKSVIEQCTNFIDTIDSKNKYLTRRREKTKAKFDSVFVVMTPAEAFSNRQTLLRSVPWEQFESVQTAFTHLARLSEE